MDIRGQKVALTPSETYWALMACAQRRVLPDLAGKILGAQIDYVVPFLSSEDVSAQQAPTPSEAGHFSMRQYEGGLAKLREIALRHAIDEAGREMPAIKVEMDEQDKADLLELARRSQEAGLEGLGGTEVAATSGVIDPLDRAMLEDSAEAKSRNPLLVTDIIATLVADLS